MKQIKFYYTETFIMLILVIIMIMIAVAFMTLFERKIMALFHYRVGPNKVGMVGLMQPFSDALKLLSKEFFYPLNSNFIIYGLTPLIMLILSMMMWMIYPFQTNLLNFKMSSLYFLAVMSTGVYPLLMMGWSSNSSFSMIGAMRSVAQSISYEMIFAITILLILTLTNSLNFFNLNYFSTLIPFSLMINIPCMILLISMLAEVNRTPFDLSEGESELVSGFNVEYGAGKFTLIFLSEYTSLMLMMMLFSMIFLSIKLNIYFFAEFMSMLYLITWIRMTFPRIRYDILMNLCWFFLLPLILILFLNLLIMIKLPSDLLTMFN